MGGFSVTNLFSCPKFNKPPSLVATGADGSVVAVVDDVGAGVANSVVKDGVVTDGFVAGGVSADGVVAGRADNVTRGVKVFC